MMGVVAGLGFVGAGLLVLHVLIWFIGELTAGLRQNEVRIAAMEDDLADVRWILDAPRQPKPFRRSDWLEGHDVD